jgi:hypothetical protein
MALSTFALLVFRVLEAQTAVEFCIRLSLSFSALRGHAVVGPVPSYPISAGEMMQGKALGMAVGVFDEAGKDISETGLADELVCTRPHP